MSQLLSQQRFQKSKVLITGHTGFKGSWLTAWLKELGAQITGISLDPPTRPAHFLAAQLDHGIQDLRIDLRDRKAIKRAILDSQPEFLFHLAAQPLVLDSIKEPIKTIYAKYTPSICNLETDVKCAAL